MEFAKSVELTTSEIEEFESESLMTKVEDPNEISLRSVTEGLLFIVGEDGLTLEQLASSLEVSREEVKKIIEKIQQRYQSIEFGIELVSYAGRYKFVSKKEVFPYAQRLFRDVKPDTLSPSALETLAIIAYKQPITRVEIEELRGVGCDMMLRKLLQRNLIQEAGRSDAPGRPIFYEVTADFLDSFALEKLEDLPELPHYEEENIHTLYEG